MTRNFRAICASSFALHVLRCRRNLCCRCALASATDGETRAEQLFHICYLFDDKFDNLRPHPGLDLPVSLAVPLVQVE
jgi:hypothetical protein